MTDDKLHVSIAEIRRDLHAIRGVVDDLSVDSKRRAEKMESFNVRMSLVESAVKSTADLPPRVAHVEEVDAVQDAKRQERLDVLKEVAASSQRTVRTVQIIGAAVVAISGAMQFFVN